MNDPVNHTDPTGQSSIFSESSYYGGSSTRFPQPPWGRSIDLGPAPFDPAYWGPPLRPDPIYLPNVRHGPAPSQGGGSAQFQRKAFTPTADLGPGHGLIPSAFNCGGGFCPDSSQNSAAYVAGAVGVAALAAAPRAWAASEIGRNQAMLVAGAAITVGRNALSRQTTVMITTGAEFAANFLVGYNAGRTVGSTGTLKPPNPIGSGAVARLGVGLGYGAGVALQSPAGRMAKQTFNILRTTLGF